MIELYSGTPGSGKSLHVARQICDHLRAGHPVLANFAMRKDKMTHGNMFTELSWEDLEPDLLSEFAKVWWSTHRKCEDSILLVIDEAQIIFNSRDFARKDRMPWLTWFAQHRKWGYKVVLVAQYDRMLDRQIRALIEYEWIHRKVSNFGIKGWLLSLLFLGKLHVAVKMWPPLREKVGSEFFVARPRYFRLYDTYKDFTAR